ncbi:hypothetical protein L1987_39002 [Smallanthus sonchifolius]|uniref:Uncharacterized protein n=1 Tax=Smallanthus sonchifolius TaxID=185202 RepID=A0ACB9HKK2_9ASTR|nr:hypothetical protein L1987_39002 [Smallanthus sonchifolius]
MERIGCPSLSNTTTDLTPCYSLKASPHNFQSQKIRPVPVRILSAFSLYSDLEAPLVRPKRKKIWVDCFVQFRWIIVIFVVLPISFTLYFLTYLGDVRSEWKSYKQRLKEHD